MSFGPQGPERVWLFGQEGRVSEFKASKKQTGMRTRAELNASRWRVRRGLSLAKARIWDPYDKSECCEGVFVRSRFV
jgi:hypothetical protein